MSFTFLRKYEIIIEREEVDFNDTSFPRQTTKVILATLNNNQIQGNFRFSSVSSSASADVNTLRIYNAEDEINKAVRQTGVKVTVKAGYEYDADIQNSSTQDLPIIYKGEVVKSKIYRNNTDTITELTLSSALTSKKESTTNISFNQNTNVQTILETVSKNLGLEAKVNLGDKSELTLTGSRSFNGNTVQILERECNRLGLTWYIQNEKIYIVNKDQLSKIIDTGIVYTIEPGRIKGTVNWSTENTLATSSQDVKTKVDFSAFLIPNLLIGDKVQIVLGDSLTTLVVDALEHKLDWRGDTWDTTITATTEPTNGGT